MRRRCLGAVLILGVLSFGDFAYAQATTGEVYGTITAAGGQPVEGAQVSLVGAQGTRTAQTDEKGRYRIELLPPGAYDLRGETPGYRPVSLKGIRVRLGGRARADVTLEVGRAMEEIVVTGSAVPTVDVGRISVSSELSSELLQRIPVGRSISDSVTLAPGVTDAGAQVLSGNPSISGSSGLENAYIVDGVNITNPGYGSIGSYSIIYGSLGTGVNFDFVETVQVKSAAFEAEHASALGGVVNVTTKRGTNEFHGSVFSYYQPSALEARRRPVSLRQGSVNVVGSEQGDVGFTLSGPIIKDKLLFFAAIDPQQTRSVRRVDDPDPNADGVVDFPLGGKRWSTQRNQSAYAANLTFNPTPRHHINVTAFGDPGRTTLGAQRGADLLSVDTSRFSELEFGGHNQVVRYDGALGESTTVQAQLAHAQSIFRQRFASRGDQRSVTDYSNVSSGGAIVKSGGVGYYEKEQEGKSTQAELKVTHYLEALGEHEIKYGLAYEDTGFDVDRGRTGEPLTVLDPQSGELLTTETGVSIQKVLADDGAVVDRVSRGLIAGASAQTQSEYLAVFLQDNWTLAETLTLSVGVRAERQRLEGSQLSFGFRMRDNVAPRLGVTWDFTGEGRGKLYGHVGRFYEKVPNDLAVRLFSQEYGITRADFVDFNGDGVLSPDEMLAHGDTTIDSDPSHFRTVGSEPAEIRQGTKSQYQDEWVLGAEYELFDQWNLGVRWIHRQIGRVLEDFQLSTAEGIVAGDEQFGAYVLGNPGSQLNETCPTAHPDCWVDPIRNYDAVELTVQKRFSRGWQVFAWYRWGRLYGNYEGLFRNDNGQSDPNLTSLFDFPNNTEYTDDELAALGCAAGDQACIDELPATMKGQGKPGLLNTNRTHLLQVAGSYSTTWGMTIGAVGRYRSGTPISGFRVHPLYENAGEVPVGKRGYYGTTNAYYGLDLHLDYAFDLGDGWKGVVLMDVLNVLDNQDAVQVVQNLEAAPNTADPDFLRPVRYAPPRQVRFGLKMLF